MGANPAEQGVGIKDIMTRGPVTLRVEDIPDLAEDVMALGRIRRIPAVEHDRLVGILSQRDLFRSALIKLLGLRSKEQKDLLKAIPIEEVMNRPVIAISPDATVREAARIMPERKIGCLPVVEGQRLVGLVTETDIMRYLVNLRAA